MLGASLNIRLSCKAPLAWGSGWQVASGIHLHKEKFLRLHLWQQLPAQPLLLNNNNIFKELKRNMSIFHIQEKGGRNEHFIHQLTLLLIR